MPTAKIELATIGNRTYIINQCDTLNCLVGSISWNAKNHSFKDFSVAPVLLTFDTVSGQLVSSESFVIQNKSRLELGLFGFLLAADPDRHLLKGPIAMISFEGSGKCDAKDWNLPVPWSASDALANGLDVERVVL